jgi:hypothetical protein
LTDRAAITACALVQVRSSLATNAALRAAYSEALRRPLDALDHALMVVDMCEGGWRSLYANPAFLEVGVLQADAVAGALLSSLILPTGCYEQFWEGLQVLAASRRAFTVQHVRLRGCGAPGALFDLIFRPITHDHLDDDVIPVGVPSYLPARYRRRECSHMDIKIQVHVMGFSFHSCAEAVPVVHVRVHAMYG